MQEAVVSALTKIASDVISTIGGVAPIAIGIVGVFMVWKLGIKFFKSVAK